MKKLVQIILLISVCLVMVSVSSAQIPNPGFESWTTGSPVSWITDNVPTIATPITQSNDAHSGTFSMQGSTVQYSSQGVTIAYPPTAYAEFPISAAYGSLNGWYKFSPVGGGSLEIHTIFSKNGIPIAYGIVMIGASTSSFTQFRASITYVTPGVPDDAYIEMAIISPGSTANAGSTFKIDDLTYGPATGVRESNSAAPAVFALSQNYPNPFNPSTKISYQTPVDGMVRLEVYDIMGRTMTTLVNEEKPAGQFTATFDASNFTSGIYFYRLHVIARNGNSFSQTNKMILMK